MKRRTAIVVLLALLIPPVAYHWMKYSEYADANEMIAKGAFEDGAILNQKLSKDVVCVLPSPFDPHLFLARNFEDKTTEKPRNTSSDVYWHLVAVDDQAQIARVWNISRTMMDLDVKSTICSRALKIRQQMVDGRKVLSVDETSNIWRPK